MSDKEGGPEKSGYAIDIHADRYESVIAKLTKALRPQTYFEIGTSSGSSLALTDCHCIAVDPKFRIIDNVLGEKPVCHFFQMTSDRFFARYSPSDFLGTAIDLAFLDGMHLFEFLLRDFMKTEKFCRPNSIIMLHDCIPSDRFMTNRREADMEQRNQSIVPDWWTGDVWKAVVILKKYRPELRIYPISTPPTGLILVTNLDPVSTTLENNYYAIVEEFSVGAPTEPNLEKYLLSLDMIHPTEIDSVTELSKYFWL